MSPGEGTQRKKQLGPSSEKIGGGRESEKMEGGALVSGYEDQRRVLKPTAGLDHEACLFRNERRYIGCGGIGHDSDCHLGEGFAGPVGASGCS